MKLIVFLLYFLTFLGNLVSQEMELTESHAEVLNNLLKMNLVIRIYKYLEDDGTWDTRYSQITIPGKAVKLELKGNGIKINCDFTPYQLERHYNLLAQSQVVLMPPTVPVNRFINSFKYVRITMGEKIYFFPLGQKEDGPDPGECSIEIELELMPYISGQEESMDSNEETVDDEITIP